MLLARAHARAASDEAAEVVGLRQRPLRTRRRDLERVIDQQLAEVLGHVLAEREIDAARPVDEEPDHTARDLLGKQHFNLRKCGGESLLDIGLKVLARHAASLLEMKKVGCEAHLQVRHSGRR